MREAKSLPPSPKPVREAGYVRKNELDDHLDLHLPVPTRTVSNEEFIPIAQTSKQAAVEAQVLKMAQSGAKLQGIDRRSFLRSSCGMAAAFVAMNSVYGQFFEVEAAELLDAAAAKKRDFFIFDVQTHHVATRQQAPKADQEMVDYFLGLRSYGKKMNPALGARKPQPEDLHLANYIKEVFLDSDTDVAAISALPSHSLEGSVIPPEQLANSKNWVNELTATPRMVNHGIFSPELGRLNLETMHVQAEKLKVDAWKGYTGMSKSKERSGWRIDDEKLSYPALELSRKLGIRNICLHKGFPLPGNVEDWAPHDVVKASKDFPDLNFLIYHSGFKDVGSILANAEAGFRKDAYVPWVSDLCQWAEKNPHMKNVYMELGTTFAVTVTASPILTAHILGMIVRSFGEDRVLWGTDSIFWGSPQWQIEAFRRFQIPVELQNRFGYKPLNDDVKAKIFGLNAARVYGVDPQAKRTPIPADYLERLKKQYREAGGPFRSNTQYGWVRA
jgi:predicted TIM-barrel fold metal-dependent hydrolase